ncbi:Protein of unknown function [Modicisalibacter ilicicola DSM 19980]|uniref:DUF3800 domain-containing protein n=1 Tax=Modicisalibacter ilicicola DSM 19980 TaxID=1121942 RepID=A0A1M4W480_9GAMM|nr:DUF3800 domain-containing protein [Halomonas ilicicola]SHE75752.1 Protein of unknown function [Halomonas ilicicola DSM 19980]
MERVSFYFDESGEKGFVKDGFSNSDVGLVAGVAMPQRCVAEFEYEVVKILSKLKTSEVEKIHATELFNKEENRRVRGELLEYMAEKQEWTLVYEAVYPLGLYLNEVLVEEISIKHKPQDSKIKISNNKDKKRIYNSLIEGLVIKLDEMCRIENSDSLVMISDHIDSSIHKEALKVLGYLKENEHRNTVTGFDAEDKKIVSKSILTNVEGVDLSVRNVKTIEVDSSVSPMTIVADIVANTLYRHIKDKISQEGCLRLHGEEVLSGYILKDKIAFISDGYVMDDLYAPS